jgi:hypothetical protein
MIAADSACAPGGSVEANQIGNLQGPLRVMTAKTLTVQHKSAFVHRGQKRMHVASLGRAFQADRRGFRPIEGGLEGGRSGS